jgi:hypothetical protein
VTQATASGDPKWNTVPIDHERTSERGKLAGQDNRARGREKGMEGEEKVKTLRREKLEEKIRERGGCRKFNAHSMKFMAPVQFCQGTRISNGSLSPA